MRFLSNVTLAISLLACRCAWADTTLTIATIASGEMTIMQQLSQRYEQQHPGIHLQWNVMTDNVLRQNLLVAMNSGKSPFDVITVGTYEAPLWGKRGWLMALNDLPANYQLDDILQPVRKALSWQGKLYALPFYGESSMTYYRKDMFAAKGLIMPDLPTWNDIRHLAAQLTDKPKGIYGLCLRGRPGWGDNTALITTMANSYGAQWFDTNWHPMLDSAQWREVLHDYVQMVHDYGPADTAQNSFDQIIRIFARGKCAMWVDSTVAAGLLINPQVSQVADKVAFAPAPGQVTRRGSNWLWSWALAVPNNAGHQAAAVDFIAWATSHDYIELVASVVGWGAVPPGSRYSTYAQLHYQRLAPYAPRVLQAMESAAVEAPTLQAVPYQGVQYVSIPGFDQMGDQVGAHITDLLEGKLTLDETLLRNQQDVLRIYSQTSHEHP
jgi:sorbitol/mannitol transport system substrate-binding protein